MQTLKTAVVVVLLIAVCYGAFIALNAPDDEIPFGIREWANGDTLEEIGSVDLSGGFEVDASSAVPMSAEDWPIAGQVPSLSGSPTTSLGNEVGSGELAAGSLPELPSLAAPPATGSPTVASNNAVAAPELPSLPGDVGSLPQMAQAAPSFPPTADGSMPSDMAATGESPATSGMSGTLISATLSGSSLQSPESTGADGGLAIPDPDLPLPDFSSSGGEDLAALPTLPLPASDADQSAAAGQLSSDVSGASTSSTNVPELPFEVAREQALAKANQGDLRDALEMLSAYYESPELGSAEHADLVNILDALSREVIYSKRHLFESAYHVQATDTLKSIADAYQMTPELLAAINGLGASKALLSSAKLKVVQGPFHARVSLSRQEMTLFLGNLYAGRFPVAIGADGPPTEGNYNVVDRRTDRTYYGPGGLVIQAGEPDNPYGGYWLSLGNNLSIHGSPEMARSDLANAGCISLAPLDAADAYIILTKASRVEIRK